MKITLLFIFIIVVIIIHNNQQSILIMVIIMKIKCFRPIYTSLVSCGASAQLTHLNGLHVASQPIRMHAALSAANCNASSWGTVQNEGSFTLLRLRQEVRYCNACSTCWCNAVHNKQRCVAPTRVSRFAACFSIAHVTATQ